MPSEEGETTGIGEWQQYLTDWEAKDKDLLERARKETVGEERNLPLGEQEAAIKNRQVGFALDVLKFISSDQNGPNEYYPSRKVVNRLGEVLSSSLPEVVLQGLEQEDIQVVIFQAGKVSLSRRLRARAEMLEETGNFDGALRFLVGCLAIKGASSEEQLQKIAGSI